MNETNQSPLAVIFFAESFSSPEVAWSLTDSGYKVVAIARKGSHSAVRSSKFVRIVEITPPEWNASSAIHDFELAIEGLAAEESPRIALLPLDDAAVWMCTQIRAREDVVVVGPKDPQIALNKDSQLKLASAVGFSVPETTVFRDADASPTRPIEFPVILKPLNSVSLLDGKIGKGSFNICQDASQLEGAIRKCASIEPMLAQQYITGHGEGLFGVASENGVMAWSAHRRIRMMNPLGSGASACESISPRPADIVAATQFISQAQWRGPFMIELLRDNLGKTWFMEFNGRVWGSTALARRCGLEYPAWAVSEALEGGRKSTLNVKPQTGIVCRHAGREAMHGLFVLRGKKRGHCAVWPSKWKTIFQLLTFRQSEYWYNWRSDDWRVFIMDFALTIRENLIKKRHTERS